MAVLKLCLSLCLGVLIAWSIGGCQGPSSSNSGQDTPVTDSGRLSVTPLSHQCHIRYAKGFTITYHKTCKVVTVFDPAHPSGETPLGVFILVPRGTRPPAHLAGTVVEVPVRRIVLGSTSCAPYFSMLGITDRIVGVMQGKLVTDTEVAARIRDGRIAEVGVSSGMATQFNIERLLVLHPDLVLSGWTNNPAWAAYIKMQGTGLPVALTADYMESTPLGRTEWIKFIAVFFDADAEAERLFAQIERRYLAMAAKTRTVHHRPTVISGIIYQGSWYIQGGRSYFAHLLKDAGAAYLWADDHTAGSAPINIESILARGLNADYWLCLNQNYYSLASLVAGDDRYRLFRAFQMGRVYSNNGRMGPAGGNDYYQGGAAHPDLILADMIAIFHPELLPGHQLIWFRHLPAIASDNASKQ